MMLNLKQFVRALTEAVPARTVSGHLAARREIRYIFALVIILPFAPASKATYVTDLAIENAGLGQNLCGSGTGTTCQYTGEYFSEYYISTGALAAFGDANGLHAQTSLTVISETGAAGTFQGEAQVQLTDHINTSGTGDGFANVTLGTEGFATGGGSGSSQLDVAGLTGAECTYLGTGQCTAHIAVSFPAGFSFAAMLNAQVVDVLSPSPGATASGIADFSDTAFISAITFTDSAGSPIAISFTSASGLNYPMTSPAPEPGSYLSFVLGLCLLAYLVPRTVLAGAQGKGSNETWRGERDHVPFRAVVGAP
jgi:hypothetical protein